MHLQRQILLYIEYTNTIERTLVISCNISHFHLFVLVVLMSWKQMLLLRVCLTCPAVRERNAEMLRHRTRLVPIGEKFAPLLSLGAHTIFVLDQAVYCKPLSH